MNDLENNIKFPLRKLFFLYTGKQRSAEETDRFQDFTKNDEKSKHPEILQDHPKVLRTFKKKN